MATPHGEQSRTYDMEAEEHPHAIWAAQGPSQSVSDPRQFQYTQSLESSPTMGALTPDTIPDMNQLPPPYSFTPDSQLRESSSHGFPQSYNHDQVTESSSHNPPRTARTGPTSPGAILLAGLTGAGKSTFISLLTQSSVTIGHDLVSCTSEIGTYETNIDGHPIRLVDTPGFDDTNRSDTEILGTIAATLAMIYQQRIPLLGVVYLHRISDPRVGGSSLKSLRILEAICGIGAYPWVVLATSWWDKLSSPSEGENRIQELKANPHFFGTLCDGGATIMRHTGERSSAEAIIKELMSREQSVVLQLQRELVDENLSLQDTTAGQVIDAGLRQRLQKQAQELAELEQALAETRDETAREAIRQEKREMIEGQVRQKEAQVGLRRNWKQLADHTFAGPGSAVAESRGEEIYTPAEIVALQREVEELKAQLKYAQDSQAEQELTLLEVKEEQRSQRRRTAAEKEQQAAQAERLVRLIEEKERQLAREERLRVEKYEAKRRKGPTVWTRVTMGFYKFFTGDVNVATDRRGHPHPDDVRFFDLD